MPHISAKNSVVPTLGARGYFFFFFFFFLRAKRARNAAKPGQRGAKRREKK